MVTLEAVDAKIDRARTEMRALKSDIAAFCEERARLIRREADGENERWVYYGGSPKAPIEWSVRAGEFAYNLRSALDHLIWQLVVANCECPGKHNEFPISEEENTKMIERRLKGIGQSAMEYIKSVQPYRQDSAGVGKGLTLLNEMCNTDKHRHLVVANVRWTGYWPKVISTANFYPMPRLDERTYEQTDLYDCVYELEIGRSLVDLPELPDYQTLQFPIDAFFADLGDDENFPVAEVLHKCIGSVEMVVSHLRNEALPPTAA